MIIVRISTTTGKKMMMKLIQAIDWFKLIEPKNGILLLPFKKHAKIIFTHRNRNMEKNRGYLRNNFHPKKIIDNFQKINFKLEEKKAKAKNTRCRPQISYTICLILL